VYEKKYIKISTIIHTHTHKMAIHRKIKEHKNTDFLADKKTPKTSIKK